MQPQGELGEPKNSPLDRFIELDVVRAVALAAVVVIHAGAWLASPDTSPSAGLLPALSGISRFCVPAFLLSSGFLLRQRYAVRPFSARTFLFGRLQRIGVPWLFSVLTFGLLAHFNGQATDGKAAWQWLVSGAGHLYFLVLIAEFYLVFSVLPRDKPALAKLVIGAFVLQLTLGWLHTYGSPSSFVFFWVIIYNVE
jgi:surface polysaccharide O-acyltransferase-like enzyme